MSVLNLIVCWGGFTACLFVFDGGLFSLTVLVIFLFWMFCWTNCCFLAVFYWMCLYLDWIGDYLDLVLLCLSLVVYVLVLVF